MFEKIVLENPWFLKLRLENPVSGCALPSLLFGSLDVQYGETVRDFKCYCKGREIFKQKIPQSKKEETQ